MSDPKENEKPAKTDTIEAHAQALGVPGWQFGGLKTRKGWPEGKQVARAEFQAELDAWLTGPTVEVH